MQSPGDMVRDAHPHVPNKTPYALLFRVLMVRGAGIFGPIDELYEKQ